MIDLGGLFQADDGPGTFADEEILQDPVVRPAVQHPTALVADVSLYLPHRLLYLVVAAQCAHLETVRPAQQGRYRLVRFDGIDVQNVIAEPYLPRVAVLDEFQPFHEFRMFFTDVGTVHDDEVVLRHARGRRPQMALQNLVGVTFLQILRREPLCHVLQSQRFPEGGRDLVHENRPALQYARNHVLEATSFGFCHIARGGKIAAQLGQYSFCQYIVHGTVF